jgi:hypothetical protein
MRECLDEGIIQSYVDGELSLEMMEAAATHIAACAKCAEAAREAEDEINIMASALAPEMSLNVPTARLRERIDAAIAELQPQQSMAAAGAGSRIREWLGALFAPVAIAPRHAFGFASLAAVLAFAVIFSVVHQRNSGSEQASEVVAAMPVDYSIPEIEVPQVEAPDAGTSGLNVIAIKQTVKKPRPRLQPNRQQSVPLMANNSPAPKQPVAPKDTLLPGERSYLTAIASLTTTLENSGDAALKPSLRAEYERNLAVVDQAIEATRRAARSNPNDDDAASFLLVAYQSKVDLLNTVADQARLSASAR